MKAGFIGLGHMGAPMAQNVYQKDGIIVLYNRSTDVYPQFTGTGVTIAKDAEDVAKQTDVIFLSLPGPVQVEEIGQVLIDHGREGQIIVDLSTVSPQVNMKLVAAAKEKGMVYIDVPVSGGPAGAKNGTLSLMIGATKEEIDALGLQPYLDVIGGKYFYMGVRSGGTAIKLINNYMSFATQVINGEAIAMADSLGIDLDAFYDVVTQSSGNNAVLVYKMNKVKQGDYQPGFAMDLVMKDLELARQLCYDAQLPNYTLNTAIQAYRLAQKKGYGQEDSSAVIKSIRETYAGD